MRASHFALAHHSLGEGCQGSPLDNSRLFLLDSLPDHVKKKYKYGSIVSASLVGTPSYHQTHDTNTTVSVGSVWTTSSRARNGRVTNQDAAVRSHSPSLLPPLNH